MRKHVKSEITLALGVVLALSACAGGTNLPSQADGNPSADAPAIAAPRSIEEVRAQQLESHPERMNDRSILRHLARVTAPHERAVLYAVLSELPERNRADVVYFAADGKIYANNPRSKSGAHWASNAIGPAWTKGCKDTGGTGTTYCKGAFYRHFSNRNHADTQESMQVANLPCYNSGMALAQTTDAGFISLGGSTFKGNSNASYASVDAGLEFVNQGGTSTPESYFTYTTPTVGYSGSWPLAYWKCGQTVQMSFSEPSATLVSLAITGTGTNGLSGTETTAVAVSAGDGWGSSCAAQSATHMSCQVKRSISLMKSDSTVFPDGSYFGVASAGAVGATPTITWSNPMEGPSTGLAPWTDTEYQTCGPVTFGPASTSAPLEVIVSAINSTGSETIGIQSQGVAAASNSCVVAGL